MQDTNKTPEPESEPTTHDQLNRPGLTNGVPDQAQDAEPKGSPNNDRHATETSTGDNS